MCPITAWLGFSFSFGQEEGGRRKERRQVTHKEKEEEKNKAVKVG